MFRTVFLLFSFLLFLSLLSFFVIVMSLLLLVFLFVSVLTNFRNWCLLAWNISVFVFMFFVFVLMLLYWCHVCVSVLFGQLKNEVCLN